MAKAKVVRKTVAKKPVKAEAAAIKPIKETLTKSALINRIAEENELPRKTAASVYATLENLFLGSVHPRGVGEFTLPGLLKVGLRKVPARKAGTLWQETPLDRIHFLSLAWSKPSMTRL